jgi:hypothetical protein
LRKSDSPVDFQRLARIDSETVTLNDYQLGDAGFEEGPVVDGFDVISSEMDEGCDDGSSSIVKTISASDSRESLSINIEQELNLSHALLGRLALFLALVRVYHWNGSL